MRSGPLGGRFEYDADPGVQNVGNAPQGTEGMAFVAGGLQPADLLLGSLEQLGEVFLGGGAALEFGVDLSLMFTEVHESNMRKAGGGRIINVTNISLKGPRLVNKKIVLSGDYLATTFRFIEKK